MVVVACFRLVLVFTVFLHAAESKYVQYNTTSVLVPGKLNVHLVAHTHDDVGWLKTMDQYYVGSNNSFQEACVQNVLDSLVLALLADKNRKFVYTEQIRVYRKDWDLGVNQPVAGNYHPINLGIYTKDSSTELSVLVDRSMGGSSIVDGQLELMIHRRLYYDDARGVGEALNETLYIQDDCKGLTERVLNGVDHLVKRYTLRFFWAFTEQDGDQWTKSYVTTFSGMNPSYSLPNNVAILTIQELEDGKVLFRLAHLYEIEEDKNLSVMASVELKKVFADKRVDRYRSLITSEY